MKYVLYHKNCHDGTGAAYAFWKRFPNYIYLEAEYGKPIPTLHNAEHVYIVDFSYKRAALLALGDRVPVTVIDHHKTAQADLQGLKFAHFDMDQSGAMLAWKFVHGSAKPPKLIEYIQDRDLWKKALPYSEEISCYMFQYPRDFPSFCIMERELETNFDGCVCQGRAIMGYIYQQVNMLAAKARKGILCDEEVLFVNTPILQSEIGNKLITEGKAAIVACYADTSEGGVYISLRSRKDVDCSKIAEFFGGGGHKNASGFHIPYSATISLINGHWKTLLRDGTGFIQSKS